MFLATAENRRWRRWAWWMLLLLVGSYVWYTTREYPHGGTPMGIFYGLLGVGLLLILMLYGLRKRAYTVRIGMLQTWVHSHIYLGLLMLVIILLHSGFRFHDTVAVTALILLTVVVVSGVVGVVLYTLVPPLLINVDSNLTVPDMSVKVNQLAQAMARLASGKSAAFQAVYTNLLQAQRPHPLAGWRLLFGRPGLREADEATDKVLQVNLEKVEPQEQTDLAQLYVLAGEMRQMHLRLMQKQRYRNILDVWLYLHVPLSFALLLVVAVHVIVAFYYSRWGVVLWRTF